MNRLRTIVLDKRLIGFDFTLPLGTYDSIKLGRRTSTRKKRFGTADWPHLEIESERMTVRQGPTSRGREWEDPWSYEKEEERENGEHSRTAEKKREINRERVCAGVSRSLLQTHACTHTHAAECAHVRFTRIQTSRIEPSRVKQRKDEAPASAAARKKRSANTVDSLES